MKKKKNINITLLNRKYYTHNRLYDLIRDLKDNFNRKYYTYNCLYDLIRDLKDNFNDEKEYAILYEDLCKDIFSIEFLDSIDEIETIDLQLIILHTKERRTQLPSSMMCFALWGQALPLSTCPVLRQCQRLMLFQTSRL
jgi:hypothetical protein